MAKKSFEENMERIIEIARTLENDDVSLNAALALYKEAVKTAKTLKTELTSAKGEVVIMKREMDEIFMEDDAEDDEF